jgi:RNA polymerase sigma factor (sigma-70 family)
MPTNDADLVARARAGDADAYAALLRRHQPALARACARMLGDPVAAADVAQDAALVGWLQLDRLREPERFGAWLAGIGRMLALRELRERAGARDRLTPDGALPDRPAEGREDPVERALAGERAAELAAAISSLPPGQRDAVVLFHLADLPQDAVAARLGTAPGAVRTRLHKARAALRVRLRGDDQPPTTKETAMPDTAVPARIVDVRRTPAGRHVVLLAAGDRELPIWIGAPEAEALAAGLEDVQLPRPSTHAFALSLVRASGREPRTVRITRLDEAIFYAEVVLDDGAAVDARPSDALVLATAAGVPVEVDRAVLDATAGDRPGEFDADLAAARDDARSLADELRAEMASRAEELDEIRRRYAAHDAPPPM